MCSDFVATIVAVPGDARGFLDNNLSQLAA